MSDCIHTTEITIVDEGGKVAIGRLRIKSSRIQWKPKNGRKYYSVPLERFTDWIMDPEIGAQKVRWSN